MDIEDPRRNTRRFRRFRPGDEVNLCLCSDLSRELGPAAAARMRELRADGVDRLPVQVVKAPRAVLGAQDAVKVDAPDLVGTTDPTVYVRVEFLELPITQPTSEPHLARTMPFVEEREKRAEQRNRDADDRHRIANSRDRIVDE